MVTFAEEPGQVIGPELADTAVARELHEQFAGRVPRQFAGNRAFMKLTSDAVEHHGSTETNGMRAA